MRFFDYFDRIWIISLIERVDRRRRIERELARIGLPLTPGKIEFFDGLRSYKADGFPSPGSRGCVMSHRAVLDLAMTHGCRRMIALEDDVIFRPDFKACEAAAVAALEQAPGWGIVEFGHLTTEPVAGNGLVVPPREVWGTHFYATNSSAVAKLKTWFEGSLNWPAGHPDGGRVSADGVLNHFRWANPDIPAFLYSPMLGKQDNSPSDISGRKWFDNIPLAGSLIRRTRDLLHKKVQWK